MNLPPQAKKRKHEIEVQDTAYYTASADTSGGLLDFPDHGMSARHTEQRILDYSCLDFKPELNTSSFVNVVQEPEEAEVALKGLQINLADQTVYPGSYSLHNDVVNLTARLWNAPAPDDGRSDFAGAVTVGSTEACLLAGLALKFRWRKWNAEKHGLSEKEARRAIPNLVISTTYQAAWEVRCHDEVLCFSFVMS